MSATTYKLIPQSVILSGIPATIFLSPVGVPSASTNVILVIESGPGGVASPAPQAFDPSGDPVTFQVTFPAPGTYTIYSQQFPSSVMTDPYTAGSPLLVTVTAPAVSEVGIPVPGPLKDPTNPQIKLLIGIGATRTFYLLDENSQPEDLSGATSATLTIKKFSTDTVPVLQKSTVAGSLAIISGGVVATFLAADLVGVSVGSYVADVAVQISGVWYNTVPFEVSVLQPITVPS